METITGMVDPLGQIVRECEAGNVPRKSVALTYAFGLRQEAGADWTAANEAIRARFRSDIDPTGIKALEKVKNLAWDYLEGRKTPGGA